MASQSSQDSSASFREPLTVKRELFLVVKCCYGILLIPEQVTTCSMDVLPHMICEWKIKRSLVVLKLVVNFLFIFWQTLRVSCFIPGSCLLFWDDLLFDVYPCTHVQYAIIICTIINWSVMSDINKRNLWLWIIRKTFFFLHFTLLSCSFFSLLQNTRLLNSRCYLLHQAKPVLVSCWWIDETMNISVITSCLKEWESNLINSERHIFHGVCAVVHTRAFVTMPQAWSDQLTSRPSAGRGGTKREKRLSNETETSQRWHVSPRCCIFGGCQGEARGKIDANIQALLPDEMIRRHHLLSLYLQSFSFTTMLFLL